MEQLTAAVLAALKAAEIPATAAMPDMRAPRLQGCITAVSIREARAVQSGFYEYLGILTDAEHGNLELYGKRLEAQMQLDVLGPAKLGAAAIRAQAEKVADVLFQPIDGLQMGTLSIGACTYDRDADCFCQTVTVELQAYVYATRDEDETQFQDFILKGQVL